MFLSVLSRVSKFVRGRSAKRSVPLRHEPFESRHLLANTMAISTDLFQIEPIGQLVAPSPEFWNAGVGGALVRQERSGITSLFAASEQHVTQYQLGEHGGVTRQRTVVSTPVRDMMFIHLDFPRSDAWNLVFLSDDGNELSEIDATSNSTTPFPPLVVTPFPAAVRSTDGRLHG